MKLLTLNLVRPLEAADRHHRSVTAGALRSINEKNIVYIHI